MRVCRKRRGRFSTPIPVADGQEEVLFGGEVLVDGAFRVTRRICDIVQSRCGEALFGEYLLRGIQEKRSRVLEASLPRPTLSHTPIVAQNLRDPLVYQIPVGIFAEIWPPRGMNVCVDARRLPPPPRR